MSRTMALASIAGLVVASVACQAVAILLPDDGDEGATAAPATEAAVEASANPNPTATAEQNEGQRPAELDPCDLLTAAEVEAVYGADPSPAERTENDFVALGASPACLWRGVGARITVLLPPPGQDPAAYYAETVRRMHPSEPLPDLGDEAWIDPGDGDLLFRSGQEYILVEHVPNPRSAEAPELTRGLAELILAKLP